MTNSCSFVRITLVLLSIWLLAAVLVLPGCGRREAQETKSGGFPLLITDDLGRSVKIAAEPEKIVSLAPAITEILFALGLDEKVAGVTEYCDYPPKAKDKPKVGGFSTPNTELVAAVKPDLVLASTLQADYIRQMEGIGLTVVALEAKDLPGVLEKIKLVGRLTGKKGPAEELAGSLQRRIDGVAEKTKDLPGERRPLVLFEIWPDPLTTGGAQSFLHNLIVLAGGRNVAGGIEKDWVTLNPEAVLAANPDVIIYTHHGQSRWTAQSIAARPGWENIRAVKEGRIGSIEDENLVVRAGPRLVEGLEQTARLIHPELFN